MDYPAHVRSLIGARCTADEIAMLSQHFVADRLRALGGLRASIPTDIRVKVAFIPTKEPFAYHVTWRGEHLATLSAGLFELMRAHCVSSVWVDRITQLQAQLGAPFEQACATRDLVNLRLVLFLCGRGRVPPLADFVSESLREAGLRIAEVTTLFILLHEIGHSVFVSLTDEKRVEFARGVDLLDSEPLDDYKIEEFFADQFPLTTVDSAAVPVLLHGSLPFFTLQAFAESHGLATADRHPRATNRISAMLDYARRCGAPGGQWRTATKQQLVALRALTPASRTGHLQAHEERLDRLTRVSDELEARLDWRETLRATSVLVDKNLT